MSSSIQDDVLRITFTENFLRKLALALFCFYCFDPLSIYKGTYKHANKRKYTQLYLRPDLRLKLGSNFDKWLPRARKFTIVVYALIFIRFTTICLIQIAKYHSKLFVSSEMIATNMIANGRSGVAAQIYAQEETEIIKLLKRWYLYHLFGTILSDFPSIALPLYCVLLVSATYTNYYLPLYYKSKPPDASELRMALIPAHETKRLDWLLRHKIHQLVTAMLSYEYPPAPPFAARLAQDPKAGLYLKRTKCYHEYDSKESIRSESLRQYHLAETRTSLLFSKALRPGACENGYRRYWKTVKRTFPMVVLPPIAFSIIIVMNVAEWTTHLRCKIIDLDADECTFSNAFTVAELFSLVEIVSVFYWIGIMLCVSTLAIFAHLDAQLIACREMKQDLRNLFEALKFVDHTYELYFSCSNTDHMVHRLRTSYNVAHNHLAHMQQQEELLDDEMLKTLAKVKVQLGEFTSRATFMSEQASSFAVFFAIGMIAPLLSMKLDGPDIEVLRMNVIQGFWLAANAMMLIYAYLYAKMIKLQKYGWRIVAQLNARVTRNAGKLEGRLRVDPLTRCWLTLVETGRLVDQRTSVRAFGVNLTYERVLQMNFYVTSLAVLVSR